MNKEKKLEFFQKMMDKSPKFKKKVKEQMQVLAQKENSGSGLKDNLSFNTQDSIDYEIIRD